jgi:threonine dehydrogenase-like Zn-dependent dehydrogenase
MRAIALDFNSRAPAEIRLNPPEAPGPGEVLFRVEACGVCATDRELARFHYGAPPLGETRLVLGHEAVGEIVALGAGVTAGVTRFALGDRVVPTIRRACPAVCPACAARRFDLCATGNYLERGIVRAHGYFAEFAVDPADSLVAIPRSLGDRAILAEPLSVVEKAIATALAAHPFQPRTALITGCGPVGLLAAFALMARGFDVEIASLEAADEKRPSIAARAGARYVRLPGSPSPADLVFEASSHPDAAALGLSRLRTGGVLVFIGASQTTIPLTSVEALRRNLTIAGIVNAAGTHFQAALEDLARFPQIWLDGFVERRPFDSWRNSLTTTPEVPKVVHMIG